MTQAIRVWRWDSANVEPLTEAAVRAKYPSEMYRVSVFRYPPQTKLGGGGMRAGTCHVLSGAGRYVFESEVVVRAGDVAELPEGRYSLEVIGDDELVEVLCWELPPEFRPSALTRGTS
jgi:hypothetical protein